MPHLTHAPLRLALIGYGSAARIFHAPLISGVPGLQLAMVCSTKPRPNPRLMIPLSTAW